MYVGLSVGKPNSCCASNRDNCISDSHVLMRQQRHSSKTSKPLSRRAKQLLTLFVSLPLLIFLWEHIALTNNIKFKPTYIIGIFTSISREIWRLLGICAAYLGTYYEYLHLEQLGETIISLATSIANFLTSFVYFFKGFQSIASQYNSPELVYMASAIAVLIVIFITLKFILRRMRTAIAMALSFANVVLIFIICRLVLTPLRKQKKE